MDKRNYNYMAMANKMPIDDMDVVEAFNLDPKVAYTPEINTAALNEAMRRLKSSLLEEGSTEEQANTEVAMYRDAVMEQINTAKKMAG